MAALTNSIRWLALCGVTNLLLSNALFAQLGEPLSPFAVPGAGLSTPPANPTTSAIPGIGPNLLEPGALAPGNTAQDEAAMKERMEKAKQVGELLKAEKYAEAETMLKAELEKNPDDAGAWFFLGGTYRLENKLDDAIEAYGKSIDLYSENGDAYLRRGIAWFHKGEYTVALIDFETAAAYSYSDPRPEFWKGLCLVKIDRPRLAIASFSASIKTDNIYVPAHVNRALAYMQFNDFAAAVLDLSAAIRIEPKNAQLYYYRGIAYAKNREPALAKKSYEEALRLKPDFHEARENLSQVSSQVSSFQPLP
jgi:tetratricopeptide (TPR) repeat protein